MRPIREEEEDETRLRGRERERERWRGRRSWSSKTQGEDEREGRWSCLTITASGSRCRCCCHCFVFPSFAAVAVAVAPECGGWWPWSGAVVTAHPRPARLAPVCRLYSLPPMPSCWRRYQLQGYATVRLDDDGLVCKLWSATESQSLCMLTVDRFTSSHLFFFEKKTAVIFKLQSQL